jgi:hypothetical protein
VGAAVTDLKKIDEPWCVGYVPETGELVFSPTKGPMHARLVHLRAGCWVCAACRVTVRKGSEAVDPWGTVYHRKCFPYDAIRERLRQDGLPKLEEQ